MVKNLNAMNKGILEICHLTGKSVSEEPFPCSRYSNVWSQISNSNLARYWRGVLAYLWAARLCEKHRDRLCAADAICNCNSKTVHSKRAKIRTAYFWPKNGISTGRKRFFWAWFTCIAEKVLFYSGGRLRFYSKNVSFCLSPTNDITKTNKAPLKSPIKMLPEMQKQILNFSKYVDF